MPGVLITLLMTASAVWVYLDATRHGIGKVPGEGGFFNLSAGAWGAATLGLWIVAFPAYLVKRAALVEKAKTSPVRVGGRFAKAALLAAVGAAWCFIVSTSGVQPALPRCDAPEVVQLVEKLNRERSSAALSPSVPRVVAPVEQSYDAGADKRICRATSTSAAGETKLTYSIEWRDKPKGTIRVTIVP